MILDGNLSLLGKHTSTLWHAHFISVRHLVAQVADMATNDPDCPFVLQ
jgi:hypothetical protein